jgi:hypothetical protein
MLISVVGLLLNATFIGSIMAGIIYASQAIVDGIYWIKDETIVLINKTRNVLYGIDDSINGLDDKIKNVIRNLNSIDISKFKDIC